MPVLHVGSSSLRLTTALHLSCAKSRSVILRRAVFPTLLNLLSILQRPPSEAGALVLSVIPNGVREVRNLSS